MELILLIVLVMLFMDSGFLSKIAGFMGLGGASSSGKGAGGTKDAWKEYQRYVGDIDPLIQSATKRGEANLAMELDPSQNPYWGMFEDQYRRSGYGGVGFSQFQGGAADQLGSMQSAASQRAALLGAREVSTRGGLAFGGGAAAIAGEAMRRSSSEGALSRAALNFQEQSERNRFMQNMDQMRLADAAARSQFGMAQASGYGTLGSMRQGLLTRRTDSLLGMDQMGIGMRQQMAGAAMGVGLQGNQNLTNNLHTAAMGLWGDIKKSASAIPGMPNLA